MGDTTKIEWADATFNPWWGCQKVSEACTHCYAETLADRWRKDEKLADGQEVVRVGKKAAGRHLDGVEHNGCPDAR